MKILHFASIFENKAAGLSFSVPGLLKAQNSISDSEVAFLYNTKNGINLKSIDFSNYNAFVLHSYFYPAYLKLLLRIPRHKKIIICPRGAFSKSNHYSTKKHVYSFVYWSLIKVRRLKVGIHFLTENERKRSRFHLIKEFVAGNTTHFNNSKPKQVNYLNKFESKEVVYVGRFSKHIKGLDTLLDILIKYRDEIKKHSIKFSFYGPGTEDKKWLIENAKNHELDFISFYDEVYGLEKEKIYSNSMFHILTSRSEGFPMSVLESSIFATPQILSNGTNLQEIMIKSEFGIPFNNSFINEIAALTFEDYKKMCINALDFAQQHSLENIGKKTLENYREL